MSLSLSIALLAASGGVCIPAERTPDLARIEATNQAVRDAFQAGDIERIALFHHDQVIKSLGPGRYFEGKEALRADLANTLGAVELAFGDGADDALESLTICGDTAISITRFSVAWTPRNGDPGGVARGRAMIVLVRSDQAPHGWVTLREVVQPLP